MTLPWFTGISEHITAVVVVLVVVLTPPSPPSLLVLTTGLVHVNSPGLGLHVPLILQVEFITHGGLRPSEHWKLTVDPNPEPEGLPTRPLTGDDGSPHTTSESVELL